MVFAEGKEAALSALPGYSTVEFDRSFDGYKVGLFYWTKTNSLMPLGLNDVTEAPIGKLEMVSVTATAEPEPNNPAVNAVDGNMNTLWTSRGVQSIVLDMGKTVNLSAVKLAFKEYEDDRITPFTVFVSEDNENWEVVYNGHSVPYSGDFMTFYVKGGKVGRYVRIEGRGHSVSGWNAITEIEVYGG